MGIIEYRAVVVVLSLVALSWGSGCLLQNASSAERLRDSVSELNDHARWGRGYAALRIVHPDYHEVFSERRKKWDKDLKIADVDIHEVKMHDGKETATSAVAVSWYWLRDMQLRSTVIEQYWEREDDGYQLKREKVVDGDRTLIGEVQ